MSSVRLQTERLREYRQALITAAYRYLVQDRLGITGARWGLLGAEAVLKLRAIRTSGDWDDYWRFHLEREHARNYPEAKAA